EVVTVGSAVALRAVVSVVVVELALVAAEAVVLGAIDRRVVVDSGGDGFAVPLLNQEWRQCSRMGVAGSVGPDAVRGRGREVGMESAVGRHLRQRHHVADLGEELGPTLMRKES